MGNSSSSGRSHDESVDGGALIPQGVYTGLRDWNHDIVARLIVARRIAPFYRPLEDYEPTWDNDQILAARRPTPNPENGAPDISPPPPSKSSSHSKRPQPPKDISPAVIYKGAVECPICFLYYPPNINYSRCCDQAICTECFVQIKRSEPTTTHIVSEPAACPYCVQENFGVVYKPPSWRLGIGSEGLPSPFSESSKSTSPSPDPPTHKRRQKSFGADSPEVVTTDQIRPDWEAKLAAVKAAVARRANRRIIMRQVGDRLIPVGVTSGRIHALSPEEAAAVGEAEEGGSSSRRSRRRNQQGGDNSMEQYMGIAGQDLEELMLMEAMRLSLLEHEEHQRKQAEEEKKKKAKEGSKKAPPPSIAGSSAASSSLPSSSSPLPVPSTSGSSTLSPSRNISSSFSRPSDARPFSTLTAALSAASTASAVLTPARTPTPQPSETSNPSSLSNSPSPPAVSEPLASSEHVIAEDTVALTPPVNRDQLPTPTESVIEPPCNVQPESLTPEPSSSVESELATPEPMTPLESDIVPPTPRPKPMPQLSTSSSILAIDSAQEPYSELASSPYEQDREPLLHPSEEPDTISIKYVPRF
ncbi:hypothetical protein DL96DRAFT_1666668 [Flagelloscypha sp. PMI_526]|nr:hypothetical protein DL96DRAFT_1666668 [Flagelloscypha sp. PMI_526]